MIGASDWALARQSLNRPYPVSIAMVAFVSLIPAYIFIGSYARFRPTHRPAIALDDAIPLQPEWSLIYGALYLFLIVLPVFVVRQPEQIRRTVFAYLTVWLVAYAFFLLYPTFAPRPREVAGDGFGVWGLRALYDSDPPYNCFPSIHVAHSFVSALTCYRVHRRVGIIALCFAAIVAVSTLFTKQHYVLDVIGGVVLAGAAYWIFLRRSPPQEITHLDRRLAPVFAVAVFGLSGLGLAGFWMFYKVIA